MPYIKKDDRIKFERTLLSVPALDSPGKLNYLITELCLTYLANKGKSYQTLNDISGALTNANLEFYRRLSAPYEDLKIKENGDVFTSKKEENV